LRINQWDFNWQDQYYYAEPVELPNGTKLFMRYTYDNSDQNPHNPHVPSRRVTYGPQSSNEMGDLWFQILASNEKDQTLLVRKFVPKETQAQIAGLLKALELRPDDADSYFGQGSI